MKKTYRQRVLCGNRWLAALVSCGLVAAVLSGCGRRDAGSTDAAGAESSGPIRHALTDADFQSMVTEAATPVLVDFWAPWCPPCRMMEPVLAAFAEARTGRVQVVKVNTDDAPALAQRFNIRAIPTLILFRGGQAVAMHEGAMRAADLDEWTDRQLGTGEATSASNP